MVKTLIIVIETLLITPSGLTIRLLAIFRVIEADLSIFNPKYVIAKIVITLTLAPPSTNTPHNTDPLHCTSMIGSHHVHDVHVNTLASVPLFSNLHITLLCPSTLHTSSSH